MSPEDFEVLNHIESDEFRLNDEEVLTAAFDIVDKATRGQELLRKEHKEVLLNNSIRVYSTVLNLLHKVDFKEVYWKQ